MALKACKECGHKISKSAKACPQCGYSEKKTGLFTWLVLGFFLFVIYNTATLDTSPSSKPSKTKRPSPSAEEIVESTRFAKVQILGSALKENLRDPNSVEWVSITANKDASTTCFKYRAKNGFGGMSIEHTTIANGQVKTEPSDWNKYCAEKKMFDMIRVKGAI